jgi:hypothetical protein
MRQTTAIVAICLGLTSGTLFAQSEDPSFVAVNENLWVTFYDVPSHRFRSIRDEFVRRDFDSASRNLRTGASHLMIESSRSSPALAERLTEVSTQMMHIADNIADTNITTTELDKLFGRSHWLLAQHYLYHARNARDAENNRMAGRYLWAATHHMERAVLWSDARINRNLVATLDGLRDLALRLQDPDDAAAARKDRPIKRAENLLIELGKQIDRPIVLKIQ